MPWELHREPPVSVHKQREKLCARHFTEVSRGRKRQDRFRVGKFEYFHWALEHMGCPSCLIPSPAVRAEVQWQGV